jgi:hypothetical protein
MMESKDARRPYQRERLSLERLEARNLQSVVVGDVAPSARLIEPPPSSASAYHTSTWSAPGGEVSKKVKIDFSSIKGESEAVEGAFKKIKGESALLGGEFKTIKY